MCKYESIWRPPLSYWLIPRRFRGVLWRRVEFLCTQIRYRMMTLQLWHWTRISPCRNLAQGNSMLKCSQGRSLRMVSHGAYILYAPADPEVQPRLRARCRSPRRLHLRDTRHKSPHIHSLTRLLVPLSHPSHCSRWSRDGGIRLAEKGIGTEERGRDQGIRTIRLDHGEDRWSRTHTITYKFAYNCLNTP